MRPFHDRLVKETEMLEDKFLTRKEGLKLIQVVEKLKNWCHLQDKVIKDLHEKLEHATNS